MGKLEYLENVDHQPNSVVTVGTFDGVHIGHRAIINRVINKAEKRDARSVVVTFDPHPREIISPGDDGVRLLTTLRERFEILDDMGVDLVCVIPFDRDFSLLTSEEFVEGFIHGKIGVSEFVIGYDHHFGRDREGDIETVEQLGEKLGFGAYVVSKQEVGRQTVSSTKIRNTISEEGNVELAAEMLGRNYMLNGTVVHGDKRGKQIGYPTANIKPEHPKKVIPKRGVYAVRVRMDGEWKGGMMNIGYRPTFEEEGVTLEVHIFNFDEEIYGKTVQVRFVKRLREEKKFDGVDELKTQLAEDEKQSRDILGEAS